MNLGNDSGEDNELHDINVTPFIDADVSTADYLFMVAAPLATVDIKVNLPKLSAKPQPRPEKPVYLIKSDKQILSVKMVTHETMASVLIL